jgi:hypothetical protein
MNTYLCNECGAPVSTDENGQLPQVDLGIGPYEFWGDRGVHHDWQTVSPCCHAKIVEGGESLVSRKAHLARIEHSASSAYGPTIIRPGDWYECFVWRRWRSGGPSWYVVTKRLLRHGQSNPKDCQNDTRRD